MTTDWQGVTAQVAIAAMRIATSNSMLLWRKGLIEPEIASEQAVVFRGMAKLFEALQNDEAAASLWAAAEVLERKPPRPEPTPE